MPDMPKWAKALIAAGAVVAALFIVFVVFSTVVNINNCAALICVNVGG